MLHGLPAFRRRLLRWYDANQRPLPWRRPADAPPHAALDPYHVLLSEFMLQQTQVATVLPYFGRFIEQFPTIQALADADERQVLRLWQGLGYYSRARHLHATARAIVSQHSGRVPDSHAALLTLPGIGRYSAGAIASIAFDRRVPILDGNVARVLCRLYAIEEDPRQSAVRQRLWQLAEEVLPRRRVGDFNSALMELGALVCTPRNPACLICPVAADCQARASGLQNRIPPPRQTRELPVEERRVYCIEHAGRWLLQQRPPRGRWAGMWQFLTTSADGKPPLPPLAVRDLQPLIRIEHTLTHRHYRFEVFRAVAVEPPAALPGCLWLTLAEIEHYPLPRPHVRIFGQLRTI